MLPLIYMYEYYVMLEQFFISHVSYIQMNVISQDEYYLLLSLPDDKVSELYTKCSVLLRMYINGLYNASLLIGFQCVSMLNC